MKSRRATKFSVSSAAAILAAAAISALSGCVQEPEPFNPRVMQQWERSANTNELKVRPMYPLPTTQESRYVPGESEPRPIPLDRSGGPVPEGPPVPMTLQEIGRGS